MRWFAIPGALLALLTFTLLPGCSSEPEPAGPIEILDEPPPPPESEHAHPSEGPHHGSLIELGNEEYHAELVHDEQTATVTIYILDSSAMKAVPIDAKELTINLKHDGQPEQFKLTAAPDEEDPQGKSSRFISNDRELGEDLDAEGADARMVVKIGGKSYTGELAHEHEGHDHAH